MSFLVRLGRCYVLNHVIIQEIKQRASSLTAVASVRIRVWPKSSRGRPQKTRSSSSGARLPLRDPVRVFRGRRSGALEVDKLVEPALSHAMLGHKGSGRRCYTLPSTEDGGEAARGGEEKKFGLNLPLKLST